MLIRQIIVLLAVVGLLAFAADAEPFRHQRVPADAKWVMHLDLQAMVHSDVGRQVLEQMRQRGLEEKIEAFKSLYGLNPLTDFRSMTLFGTAYEPQNAVAVVQMGTTTGKLKQMVRLARDYQLHHHRDYEIHSWMETRGPHKGHRKFCGVWPDDMLDQTLLVIADRKQQVADTLDRLEGRGNDLSDTDSTVLTNRPSQGCFLFIVADELELATMKDPRSLMLQNARTVVVELGEAAERVYAIVTLEAPDAERANKLYQFMQGPLAMVQLAGPGPNGTMPPISKLAQAVTVELEENTIHAGFDYPSNAFYELLKQMKANAPQRHHNPPPAPAR